MTVWAREILGWMLLGVGLFAFWLAWQALSNRRTVDVIPMAFIATIIFRGGLHLIKVATAARIVRSD